MCKRLPARSCCDPIRVAEQRLVGETGQAIAAGPGDDASTALNERHRIGTERIRDGSLAIGADRSTAGAARGIARVERAVGLDRPVAIESADAQVRALEQRRIGFEADRAIRNGRHGDIGRIADRRNSDAGTGRDDRGRLGDNGRGDCEGREQHGSADDELGLVEGLHGNHSPH